MATNGTSTNAFKVLSLRLQAQWVPCPLPESIWGDIKATKILVATTAENLKSIVTIHGSWGQAQTKVESCLHYAGSEHGESSPVHKYLKS